MSLDSGELSQSSQQGFLSSLQSLPPVWACLYLLHSQTIPRVHIILNCGTVWRSILESQFGPGLSTLVSNNVTMVIAPEPGGNEAKGGEIQSPANCAVLTSTHQRVRAAGRAPGGARASGFAMGLLAVLRAGRAEAARGQQSAGCGDLSAGLGAAAAFQARSAVLC